MLFKNKKTVFTILIIFSLGMSGCSYKHYRNKPSIFLPTQNIIKPNDNNKTGQEDLNISLVPYCMDVEENIMHINDINKTIDGKCDGYYIVDGSKIIMIDDNATKNKVVNRLLLLSNDNCRRFVDKFYYNDFMGNAGFKLLKLDLFSSFGIQLGGIDTFTTTELLNMQKTLLDNLKYRSQLREKIHTNLDNNVSMTLLLNQIQEYDHACGLLIKEELFVGDTNLTN